jgi:choline dehydrogenase
MYLVRPSVLEVDSWAQTISEDEGSKDSSKRWTWDQFYPVMKKTETFTPPREEVARVGNFTWDADTHGTDGPMQASYPAVYVFSLFLSFLFLCLYFIA